MDHHDNGDRHFLSLLILRHYNRRVMGKPVEVYRSFVLCYQRC